MENITFTETKDFEKLGEMAGALWHSAYDGLLGAEQVGYMLGKFQNAAAMRAQTETQGYTYYFILANGEAAGYIGLQGQGSNFFLSKLYLKEEYRSRGIGQAALAFAVKEGKKAGALRMYLTVNKGNAPAIRAYERFGLVREGAEKTEIGGGYCMDDYIYACRL